MASCWSTSWRSVGVLVGEKRRRPTELINKGLQFSTLTTSSWPKSPPPAATGIATSCFGVANVDTKSRAAGHDYVDHEQRPWMSAVPSKWLAMRRSATFVP